MRAERIISCPDVHAGQAVKAMDRRESAAAGVGGAIIGMTVKFTRRKPGGRQRRNGNAG
ncbi:MAG TPA: hypothetical protein VN441_04400 [Syntrophomonas sp.]|nr:hypothetical protein [Syntrophomonas sp.]